MSASSKLVAAGVVTVGVAVGAGWYLNRRLAALFQQLAGELEAQRAQALAEVEAEMEQQVPEVKVAVETVQQVQLTLLTQHKTVLVAEEALMQVETEVQVVTELLL